MWVTDERSIPFDPSTKSAKKLAAYKTTLPPKPKEGPVFFWEAGVDILTYRKEEDGWHNNYNMNGCNLVLRLSRMMSSFHYSRLTLREWRCTCREMLNSGWR